MKAHEFFSPAQSRATASVLAASMGKCSWLPAYTRRRALRRRDREGHEHELDRGVHPRVVWLRVAEIIGADERRDEEEHAPRGADDPGSRPRAASVRAARSNALQR